ncbi:MAG: hypothetical protein MUC56_17565 [Thermoanaerobaculales bacterium]|jgi:hypothetical protein|nr:hypothetical protein [Thermoanaerobaculales bacterium]
MPHRAATLCLLASLAGLASLTQASSLETLYVMAQSGASGVMAVDATSGDRLPIDLEDYPVVMTVHAGALAPDGRLYLAAVNAALGPTIIRYDPTTGRSTGISGYVDRDSNDPRGDGPELRPGVRSLVLGPWAGLFALRSHHGPVAVDIASGDRRILSQSVEPRVGEGVAFTEPTDLVVESGESLLVADRLEGLIRVHLADGRREIAHRFPDIVEAHHRIDLLPDGRIVHAVGRGDSDALSVFDADLTVRTELSGRNRGAGPAFIAIFDLAVAPDGVVYVLDLGWPAIFAVDPATGDRRVISGGPDGRGEGPWSFIPNELPVLADLRVPPVPPAPRTPRGRIAPVIP